MFRSGEDNPTFQNGRLTGSEWHDDKWKNLVRSRLKYWGYCTVVGRRLFIPHNPQRCWPNFNWSNERSEFLFWTFTISSQRNLNRYTSGCRPQQKNWGLLMKPTNGVSRCLWQHGWGTNVLGRLSLPVEGHLHREREKTDGWIQLYCGPRL